MIFRVTKGKSFIFTAPFEVPEKLHEVLVNTKKVAKSVYIILFWDGRVINDRIKKICTSFAGQRYEIPSNGPEIDASIQRIKGDFDSAKAVLA